MSKDVMKRLPETAKVLSEQDVDIIALQEVHTYLILNLLRKKLSAYPYVLYKKYIYGPRGGLVIFSKLPVENFQYINFEQRGAFTNSSLVAHIIKNGVLMCKLKNSPLYILNTHLTPNLDFNWTEKNRFYNFLNSQLEQIASIVNTLISNKYNVVVAGDFNTSKDSNLYKHFLSKSNLIDIFEKFNSPTLHQVYLAKNKKAKRIDYIFLRAVNSKPEIKMKEHIFTKKYSLGNGKMRYLSDHLGLKTEISI